MNGWMKGMKLNLLRYMYLELEAVLINRNFGSNGWGRGGAMVVQRKWKIYNSKGGSEFLAREVIRILSVFGDTGSAHIENKNTKYKKNCC